MSGNIKCYYQNTRGLRTKIARGLRNKLSCTDYKLFAFTETWLNDSFASESIFDSGLFVVHRSDRTNRTFTRRGSSPTSCDDLRGGGSLIAISKDIPALRMSSWEMECPYDNVWLKLSTNDSTKLFVNCIYINDKTNFDSLMLYFDLLVDIVNRREPNSKFLIFGDFNIPSIEWYQVNGKCIALHQEGRMANELVNMLTFTELDQINQIKNFYNRTLDLILSSNLTICCKKALPIINEDLYHPALQVKFDAKNIKFMKMKGQNKLNFYKANYEAINIELNTFDWPELLSHHDINTSVEIFYNIVKPIIKKHTPKSLSRSSNFPIWYSNSLIQLIKEKEAYFKLKNRTKIDSHIALYKNKRREIKSEKKKCIKQYENDIKSKIGSNPKAFFSYTKSLQKSNCLPTVMKYKDKTSDNMKETADLFATCFKNVYNASNSSYQPQCDNNCSNYFTPSEEDIQLIITSLDQNKVHSPDEIPVMFYRNTLPSITKPLMIIFNLALRQMEYPKI